MLVRRGEQTDLAAPAKAEPADDVVWRDYYTRLPQIRLTGDSAPSEPATEITLDGNDVGKLVECAIRHPSPNMRYAVLAAIWNHPDSFRQIFRFGLDAAPVFPRYARSSRRSFLSPRLNRFRSRRVKRCCLGCPGRHT